jgi:23S rRNA pseudouridine1911/1915/1917 synthase
VNIPIIYEDNWLLVVNKPSGLLTIPTPKNELRTLTSILNEDLKKKDLSYRLHPSHRLDRETSGLIIYAKGKSIQKKMMELFKKKKIKKTYIAFVQGRLPHNEGAISYPVSEQAALSEYKVIEKRNDFSVVEVMPLTGRTNQIRIHFKLAGHPIVGETKYAFRRDFKLKAKRLCLHAKDLEFIHPVTKKYTRLHTDLSQDLKEFLERNP